MSTPFIAFPIFVLYLAATSTISPAVPTLTRLFYKKGYEKFSALVSEFKQYLYLINKTKN